MPRARKVVTSETPTVQERIAAAERAAAHAPVEKVQITSEDLERVLALIVDGGFSKDQVLRKALRLGLDVLSTPLITPAPVSESAPTTYKFAEEVNDAYAAVGGHEPYIGDAFSPYQLVRPGGRYREDAPEEPLASAADPVTAPEEGF